MMDISLTQLQQAGFSEDSFAAAAEAHLQASVAHVKGRPGIPRPTAHPLVEQVIGRVPDDNPVVADRKPDQFVILPYRIVDDVPKTPEQQQALNVLRETISQ